MGYIGWYRSILRALIVILGLHTTRVVLFNYLLFSPIGTRQLPEGGPTGVVRVRQPPGNHAERSAGGSVRARGDAMAVCAHQRTVVPEGHPHVHPEAGAEGTGAVAGCTGRHLNHANTRSNG
eukprot:1195751-Prorocentrum_minimum.AAC.1